MKNMKNVYEGVSEDEKEHFRSKMFYFTRMLKI